MSETEPSLLWTYEQSIWKRSLGCWRIITAFSLSDLEMTSEKSCLRVVESINVVESRWFCACWIASWMIVADLTAMKRISLVLAISEVGLFVIKSIRMSAIFFWVISRFSICFELSWVISTNKFCLFLTSLSVALMFRFDAHWILQKWFQPLPEL